MRRFTRRPTAGNSMFGPAMTSSAEAVQQIRAAHDADDVAMDGDEPLQRLRYARTIVTTSGAPPGVARRYERPYRSRPQGQSAVQASHPEYNGQHQQRHRGGR